MSHVKLRLHMLTEFMTSERGRTLFIACVLALATITALSVSMPQDLAYADAKSDFAQQVESRLNAAEPATYMTNQLDQDSIWRMSKYLTYERWRGVNEIAVPDRTIGGEQTSGMSVFGDLSASSMSAMFFGIGAAILWSIGAILTIGISMDATVMLISFVDYMFARAALALFYPSASGSAGIWILFFIVMGIVIAFAIPYIFPMSRYSFGGIQRFANRQSLISFGALLFAFWMGNASISNHMDTAGVLGRNPAPIASTTNAEVSNIREGKADENTGTRTLGEENQNGERTLGTLDNWQPLSVGWFLNAGTWFVNYGSGFVAELIDNMTTAMTKNTLANDGQACEAYVDAMHEIFLSSDAANKSSGRASILVSYDNLARSIYVNSYKHAAFGDSNSAENAFCRIADAMSNAPAEEQIIISRQAGLYPEIIGYGSLIPADRRAAVPWNYTSWNAAPVRDGTIVNSAGKWTKRYISGDWDGTKLESSALTHATLLFNPSTGPAFKQALVYWAACIWGNSGTTVRLNSEWKGALLPSDNEKTFTNQTCSNSGGEGDSAKNDIAIWSLAPSSGFGDTGVGGTITPLTMLNDLLDFSDMPFVGEEEYADAKMFWYQETNDSLVHDNFLGLKSQIASKSLANAGGGHAATAGKAEQYYNKVVGNANSSTLVPSIATMISAGFMAKHFVPTILGGTVAQLVGMVVLSFIILVLILFALPSHRTRTIARGIVQTALIAVLLSSILTIVFSLIMALVQLIRLILGSFVSSPFMESIVTSLSVIVATVAVNKFVQSRTNGQYSTGSMKTAMKLGFMSTAPFLESMGREVPPEYKATNINPFKRNVPQKPTADLLDDKTNRLSDKERRAADGTDRENFGVNDEAKGTLSRISDGANKLRNTARNAMDEFNAKKPPLTPEQEQKKQEREQAKADKKQERERKREENPDAASTKLHNGANKFLDAAKKAGEYTGKGAKGAYKLANNIDDVYDKGSKAKRDLIDRIKDKAQDAADNPVGATVAAAALLYGGYNTLKGNITDPDKRAELGENFKDNIFRFLKPLGISLNEDNLTPEQKTAESIVENTAPNKLDDVNESDFESVGVVAPTPENIDKYGHTIPGGKADTSDDNRTPEERYHDVKEYLKNRADNMENNINESTPPIVDEDFANAWRVASVGDGELVQPNLDEQKLEAIKNALENNNDILLYSSAQTMGVPVKDEDGNLHNLTYQDMVDRGMTAEQIRDAVGAKDIINPMDFVTPGMYNVDKDGNVIPNPDHVPSPSDVSFDDLANSSFAALLASRIISRIDEERAGEMSVNGAQPKVEQPEQVFQPQQAPQQDNYRDNGNDQRYESTPNGSDEQSAPRYEQPESRGESYNNSQGNTEVPQFASEAEKIESMMDSLSKEYARLVSEAGNASANSAPASESTIQSFLDKHFGVNEQGFNSQQDGINGKRETAFPDNIATVRAIQDLGELFDKSLQYNLMNNLDLLDRSMDFQGDKQREHMETLIGKTNTDSWNGVVERIVEKAPNNENGIREVIRDHRGAIQNTVVNYYNDQVLNRPDVSNALNNLSFNARQKAEAQVLNGLYRDFENLTFKAVKKHLSPDGRIQK